MDNLVLDILKVLEKFNLNFDVQDDIKTLVYNIRDSRSGLGLKSYKDCLNDFEWYLTALRSAKIIDNKAYDDCLSIIRYV